MSHPAGTVAERDVRRHPFRLEIHSSERVAPHLQRLVAGSGDIDAVLARDRPETDKYLKLLVFPPSTPVPDVLDMTELRERLPAADQPTVRTYTLRRVDHERREVTVDVVVHGDSGVAGPWAARVQPGEPMVFTGPGGGYAPDPTVDWHLLAGDESALPAIASALEAMPAGARVTAYVEVDGPQDEIPVESAADLSLTWLHRNGAPAGSTTLVADAVRDHPWRAGSMQAFVHGESSLLRVVRPYLLRERGVPRELVSVSGYWRAGENEEGFRAWKKAQPRD